MTRRNESSARYGVDIKYDSVHLEANDLEKILASLNGRAGRVDVIDRMSGSRLFEGSVNEVRSAIVALISLHSKNGSETDAAQRSPKESAEMIRSRVS